ncbi:rhodanese-like domain-containing protein [Idiomarina sp. PL1-037]|uniref:rhodanese-like domain-containing protein n=1 Tax=unclassified Idiomarina TaxID=2614829 RepID=UPI00294AB31F|nr:MULTISPECIES: rhodanese-like domain-containing protein [unclassified Idiomarina]MDV6328768.1 rhodanese-like domain-containing protein [Idiomarina sp. Sol25]WQC52129.1 rhodanese-like domain-containing protein [Idiomarina sp. PL1-037]
MITAQELCGKAKSSVKEVNTEELQEAIEQGARVIDVREPAEYGQGHIRQAVNMPRGVLEMQLNQHPDVAGYDNALERIAEKPLYLICRTGGRSALAAESLQRMGFDNVYSVDGGMSAWQEKKLPVVAGE